ncbi:hypothetical protein, partial [Staphylococcus aureus]|uniref:hypothetical protein n=1 Tax=Staphylococcus aureus TaxID=1280 RepID=UPI001E2AD5CF
MFPGGEAQPMWAVSAIVKAFGAEHAKCPAPKRRLCVFCHKPDHAWEEHVNVTTKKPGDWPSSGDTGISSQAIWN